MASSYDQQQKLNALIANDTTPNMSTIDILSSLKLINHFEDKIKAKDPSASTQIAEEELKYLKAGMVALQDNAALTQRFGSGFQGAMSIAGLLKAKQSERVYDKIIGDILDKNMGALDSVVNRINKQGGATALSKTN